MEAYSAFASVYDRMMDEIPYTDWCDYVTKLLADFQIYDGLLLELGCGTGTLTELFADKGFDMIGVDNSEDMLMEAMDKQADHPKGILYLMQDMREFELYGTVAAIISLCDTMNYLTDYDDLVQVLKLANNYLDPHGIFIFDLKTAHYFSNTVGNQVFAEAGDDFSYIWQNAYNEETCINQYMLTLFMQNEDETYDRFDELHEQRAYSLEQIKQAAAEAGMEFLAAYHGGTKEAAHAASDRIYIILREQGK